MVVLLFTNGGSHVILNDGVTERIVTSVFNSPHCHLGISPRGLADVFWVKFIKFSFVCFSSRRSKNDIWRCFRVVTRPPRLHQSTNWHILFL